MILSKTEAKTAAHQFSKFRRQIEHAEKNGKNVPVCRILFFQQIKLEKNGFRSLKERQNSFHTIEIVI